ncbi:hypothetical protein WA026_005310 [Henosepilachna vigintioctopunctata]|uniref:Uncharacterized protein n=1 Tax=Henosepilachna vigintioctopunctata TaxID=420089 RepID=A0AAW1UWN3_9CUCU
MITLTENELSEKIPKPLLEDYNKRVMKNCRIKFENIKLKNIGKFDKLIQKKSKQDLRTLFHDNSKWFKNISNTKVPLDVQGFLSLGPKFSVRCPSKDAKLKNFLAETESIVESVPEQYKNNLRCQIANILTNIVQFSHQHDPDFIYKLYRKTNIFEN